MSFDWTVSLGTVLQLVGSITMLLVVWTAFKTRVDLVLQQLEDVIKAQADRFEKHEARDEELFQAMQARFLEMTGSVQRLVGQYEVMRHERQHGDRRQG